MHKREVAPSSATSVALGSANDPNPQLSLLKEEHNRLLERRKRLVELHVIDEREEQLRRQIAELESQQR